jgi:hypothetical protein
LILALVQPLTMVSAYAAIAVHLAILFVRRAALPSTAAIGPRLRKAALTIGISLPGLAYYLVGAALLPALRQWTEQNVLPSPNAVHYLIAYAVVIVPAACGARDLVRTKDELAWLLPVWLLVLIVLAYAPVTVQRRLIDGAWVALSILAARGIGALDVRPRVRRLVAAGVLGLSALTAAMLIGGGLWVALRPSLPVFRTAEEVAAFEWIATHAPTGAAVLASFDTGNALPAWAAVRSVIGHGPETIDLAKIQPEVDRFFAGALDRAAADRLLDDQHVAFVLRGPQEARAGNWVGFPSTHMIKVYDASGYEIYAVRRSP